MRVGLPAYQVGGPWVAGRLTEPSFDVSEASEYVSGFRGSGVGEGREIMHEWDGGLG